MAKNGNPYAMPNGAPKPGQAFEFLEWERKKMMEEINALPPKQKAERLAGLRNIHAKQQS